MGNIIAYGTENFWLRVHRWDIKPLLGNVPVRFKINLSIWSLIYEWRCYVMLAICGVFPVEKFRLGLLFSVALCTWLLKFRAKVLSHWAIFALSCFLIVLGLHFNLLAVVGPRESLGCRLVHPGLCVSGLCFCGFEPDFGGTAGTPLERALAGRIPSFGLSKAGLSGDTRPSLLWVGAG